MRTNRYGLLATAALVLGGAAASALAALRLVPEQSMPRRASRKLVPQRQSRRYPELNRSKRWAPMPSYRAAAEHSERLGVRTRSFRP